MKSYYEIFREHTGLMSFKVTHYFFVYDLLFSKLREAGKPVTILEIGVCRGGSLEIWKKYLPEGSVIHGVDIDSSCAKIKFSDNIFFHLGSASDAAFMEKTFGDVEFDFILDDGSHNSSDVIKAFDIMFPKIKSGGLYVAEDLCTSYWKEYGGGLCDKKSSIEYFKSLVEYVNGDYIGKNAVFRDVVLLPSWVSSLAGKIFSARFIEKTRSLLFNLRAKRNKDAPKIAATVSKTKTFGSGSYRENIESVTFYDCICTIKKYGAPKLSPNKQIYGGYDDAGGVLNIRDETAFMEKVKAIYGGPNA
jgi:hypothetical protein